MKVAHELVSEIRRSVAEDLAAPDQLLPDLGPDDRREYARQRIYAHLDRLSAADSIDVGAGLGAHDEEDVVRHVLDSLFGLGRLQALIDDPRVENIDVNGCDRVWVTYADGTKLEADPVAESDEELVDLIRSVAARFSLSERRFDTARPELDLRLPDGSRLSALMSVSVRPSVSIRRHRLVDLSIDDLVQLRMFDTDIASLLKAAVRSRRNIIVAGAMNSGKTTLLRALASAIPPYERIVTIEQAFELALDAAPERHPDIVALEARPPNLEGEGEITVADLVRRALRMNADRVIVGEVLGGEVLPMLNAMSQGRSGSMCTIHADSSAGAFRRIASYAIQAQERLPIEATNLLIAGSIHFVVFVDMASAGDGDARGNPRSDGDAVRARRHRFVSSIREVVDCDGVNVVSNEIYRPGPDRRAVRSAPLRAETLADLVEHGYEPGRVEASFPVGVRTDGGWPVGASMGGGRK